MKQNFEIVDVLQGKYWTPGNPTVGGGYLEDGT